MQTGSLKVHTENLLPIIKKWLYSEREIFLRELVSNSNDALQKLRLIAKEENLPLEESSLTIRVTIDKERKALLVSDGGIGMDREEVEKYICQLAFSGAEEFLKRYKGGNEGEQIIGHFGLGFYSAFMVAKSVEIDSLSYQAGKEPVLWRSTGGSDYEIGVGTKSERGTTVTLFLDEENEEFLEESKLEGYLKRFCSFFPFPLFLGERRINEKEPLWLRPPAEIEEKEYRSFFSALYPMEPEPFFWVHLSIDYPFNLKGILYFPKIDMKSNWKEGRVKLYSNRVFVSDNCRDLIPTYLNMLEGIIDGPDIPLNVSRSMLQMDSKVRQLTNHISKKVSDALKKLYENDRDRFISLWPDVGVVVKLGCCEDEKFYERVRSILVWENSEGGWTTIDQLLEEKKEEEKKTIYYTLHKEHAPHLIALYREKKIPVLFATSPIDSYLINSLEARLKNVSFKRIDADLHEALEDKSKERNILDASGRSESAHFADFGRRQLREEEKLEVEAKSLANDSLPAFILLKEESRRMRDYFKMMGNGENNFDQMVEKTLILNTNSPLIDRLRSLEGTHPELVKEAMQQLLELTLIAQRELDPKRLSRFIDRSFHLMELFAKEVEPNKASTT